MPSPGTPQHVLFDGERVSASSCCLCIDQLCEPDNIGWQRVVRVPLAADWQAGLPRQEQLHIAVCCRVLQIADRKRNC